MIKNRLKAFVKTTLFLNLFIFSFYLLVAIIANWSLIVGENIMKWDIMDAHYPTSVFLADSLRSGILPIWNPAINFGTPYYSFIGMPVWYPSTIIFAFLGYPTRSVGAEYVIHIAFACFGMYLLAKDSITSKKQSNPSISFAAVAAGLFYGFSTVFLSNAEHIMIVISATWIPFVLLFARKYLRDSKIISLLISGWFAGLIILGGYPELLVALFIVLFPFFLYYNPRRKSMLTHIFSSASRYILLGLFTLFSSAITVIPFIFNMKYVVRMSQAVGTTVVPYSPVMLISMFLPKVSLFTPINDISMINFYMGLLTFISIPALCANKDKNKLFNLSIVAFSFLMILGPTSFLHSLFYRFFPMFDTLRFPGTWKSIFSLFLLSASVNIWNDVMENNHDSLIDTILATCKKLLIVLFTGGFGIFLFSNLTELKNSITISESFVLSGFFVLLYFIYFKMLNDNQFKGTVKLIALISIVLIEVLTFQYLEAPITITKYSATAYSSDLNARNEISQFFSSFDKRNKSVDFAQAIRAKSGLNSSYITINKVLDEEGYASVKFSDIEQYKGTANRLITSGNPVAYLTDNIVTENLVDFGLWANNIAVEPNQIFIADPATKISRPLMESIGDMVIEKSEIIDPTLLDGVYVINGIFSTTQDTTKFHKLSVYLNQTDKKSITLSIGFIKEDHSKNQFSALNYVVHSDKNGNYFDVYFPTNETYTGLEIVFADSSNFIPYTEYMISKRMTKATDVQINSFLPNSIYISTTAKTDGYLTILQSFFPGWKAYVDGNPVSIEKVNNAFMGVFIAGGNHQVSLKFRPLDFYIGAVISSLYFIFLLIGVFLVFIKKQKEINK